MDTKRKLKVTPIKTIAFAITGKQFAVLTKGGLSEKELQDRAERLVKCWNSHDALLASDEERKAYAVTIRKIWAALGITDYQEADGKSIDELVLLVKKQRDDLLAALGEASKDFYHIHCHSENAHSDSYGFMNKAEQVLAKAKDA